MNEKLGGNILNIQKNTNQFEKNKILNTIMNKENKHKKIYIERGEII